MEPQAISKFFNKAMRQSKPTTCPEHGPYTAQRLGDWPWTECPTCCDIKQEKELKAAEIKKAEEEKIRQEKELAETRRAAGLWQRFDGKGFDNFDFSISNAAKTNLEIARNYADNFPKILKLGRSMIFAGSYGTGKTHLATAIVDQLLSSGHSAMIVCVYDLLSRLKATWSKAAVETERQAFQAVTEPDLLVIDEVGVQFGSQAEKTLLFQVFNKRYLDLKPTIVISNEDAAGIKDFLGERVYDRLRENGGRMLVFDWPSARKTDRSKTLS